MTQGERNKVVVYRELEDGYRWRLRPYPETSILEKMSWAQAR